MNYSLLLIIIVLEFMLPPPTTSVVRVKQGISDRKMVSGARSFRDLLTHSSMFVDKTLLIKDFLELPTRVVLVTCPRRWGKSLNMDMIREFLQITPEEVAHQTIPHEASGKIRLQRLLERSARDLESHNKVKLAEIEKHLLHFDGWMSKNASHQDRMTGRMVPLHGNFSISLQAPGLKKRARSGNRLINLTNRISRGKPSELNSHLGLTIKPLEFDQKQQSYHSSCQKHRLSKLTAIGDDINSLFNRKSQSRNKTGPRKRSGVSAYRLFSHGETETGNYSGLTIADHPNIISQYLGQHPVLCVSLLIPFGNSFDRLIKNLQQKLAQLYTDYAHAFETRAKMSWGDSWESAHVHSPWDEEIREDPWHDVQAQNSWEDAQVRDEPVTPNRGREMLRKLRAQNATEAELAGSLRLLSQLLHKRYAARAFVLIDDYDTPVNLAFARFTGDSRDWKRTIAFLAQFFRETFANNPHVEKGLVTGVNAIAVQEMFGQVDYEHHHMLRSQVSRHYGFSENDVTRLFQETTVPLALAATAKKFYAGYALGPRRGLCNPWDISQFLKMRKLRRWWVETGGAGFFDQVFRFRALEASLLTLISHSSVEIALRPSLTAEEYAALKDMLAGRILFDACGAQFFLSFIFAAGYITRDNDVIRLGGARQEETTQVWVRLPNEEIGSELTEVLLRYYDSFINLSQRGDVRRSVYVEFQKIFKDGSTASLQEALEAFLKLYPRLSSGSAVRAALNHILLSIRPAEGDFSLKTEIEGEAKHPRMPALAVADPGLGVGVILELEFGLTGDVVLNKTKGYLRYLSDRRVKKIRLLGVGVFPNGTVSIKDTWRVRKYEDESSMQRV